MVSLGLLNPSFTSESSLGLWLPGVCQGRECVLVLKVKEKMKCGGGAERYQTSAGFPLLSPLQRKHGCA